MKTIQDALRRIQLQQQGVLRSLLAYPVDVSRECKRLSDVAADFAQRATDARPLAPPLDPKQVWRQWTALKYDIAALDPRQVRTLCVEPSTATTPELVNALHRQAAPLQRTSCLMGLIFSYFTKWGDIRHQDQMESLIVKALRSYNRRNPLLIDYRQRASTLFQAGANTALASQALVSREPPKSLLNHLRIGLATNLATATISTAVRDFLAGLPAQLPKEEGLRSLKYATDHLLVPELPGKVFYRACSDLVVRNWIDKYPECQTKLRRFIVSHPLLGDPRLKVANWASMEAAARARFLQWIAKESIVFFFNHVLPDDSANERRKNFWLDYAPAIRDFQVALSDLHHGKLLAASRLSEVPGFGRVKHPITSAFIMRFAVRNDEDIVIVEFSENGNAAHVFYAGAFEAAAGKLRSTRFEFSKLKHEIDDDRIVHRGDWEYHARNKLARWGVRC